MSRGQALSYLGSLLRSKMRRLAELDPIKESNVFVLDRLQHFATIGSELPTLSDVTLRFRPHMESMVGPHACPDAPVPSDPRFSKAPCSWMASRLSDGVSTNSTPTMITLSLGGWCRIDGRHGSSTILNARSRLRWRTTSNFSINALVGLVAIGEAITRVWSSRDTSGGKLFRDHYIASLTCFKTAAVVNICSAYSYFHIALDRLRSMDHMVHSQGCL